MGDASIDPFTIAIDDAALDDLRRRLDHTRWPDSQPADDWSYGLPLAYARELAAYWRNEYDWRAAESSLNTFPQFTTTIDGANVHFLHVRSTRDDATPLLLTHGWPGSFVEFVDVIGPLTEPPADQPAFHVVVPTLPGYGFSGHTTDKGWTPHRIARAWAELMARLGYERYGAHGGDWGSVVTHALLRVAPDNVIGAHLTMLASGVPGRKLDVDALPGVTDADRALIKKSRDNSAFIRATEMGYFMIQSTKPQTLAYGLADSPVGQMAWIAEKFKAWTDNTGLPESAVERDALLTNVCLYWFTNTAGSSARLYYETAWSGGFGGRLEPSTVPVAVMVFPKEIMIPVRRVAEQFDNIVRWSEPESGGHFAALEEPDVVVPDIREFFAGL